MKFFVLVDNFKNNINVTADGYYKDEHNTLIFFHTENGVRNLVMEIRNWDAVEVDDEEDLEE